MTEKGVRTCLGGVFGRYLKLEVTPIPGKNHFIMLADPDGEIPEEIIGQGESWFDACYDFALKPETTCEMLIRYKSKKGRAND